MRMPEPGTARARAGRGFRARWLAEALRLDAAAGSGHPDGDIVESLRSAAGRSPDTDTETLLLAHAERLAQRVGLAAALDDWRRRAGWVLGGLALLAAAGGFGSALAVVGDGSRAVNVAWTLLGLLGLPTVMLLLWMAAVVRRGPPAPLGQAWLWLGSRIAGRKGPLLGAGLLALLGRGRTLGWALGAASHALWAAALGGALAGLLLALALRHYAFGWETTILPAGPMQGLVLALGWLPGLLGFTVPDAALVAASVDPASVGAAGRRAWAGWLVGCVLAWGLLPRLLLGLFCLVRLRIDRHVLALDTDHPHYLALAARLAGDSQRMGVSDPDPGAAAAPRFPPPRQVAGDARAVVGVELRTGIGWPPPELAHLPTHRADGREQRNAVRAALAATPPARLLLACDPRLSPDRGSLALLTALAGQAGRTGVWLVDAREADATRLGLWREMLDAAGLDPRDRPESLAEASAWLDAGPPRAAADAPG